MVKAASKRVRLDVRLRHLMATGGDSGEAIIPGKPDQSLLIERVTSGEMPPEDKRLSEQEIAKLRAWIQQGAKTARDEPETLDGHYITEEERSFWSFQPIRRPAPPNLRGTRNPIDAFVLRRLQQEQLTFSPKADRVTLIRRATFDLLGLPPEPEMVDAFVHDPDPNAYAKLIDRLLADPRYGERWGRHWLDVAGYADSEGYTNQDVEREFAYFYRDYVIRSFNSGKPLDQFIREQLAGDEMPADQKPGDDLTGQRIEQLTATGFLRMAPDGTASGGVDRNSAANDTIADTINIVSSSLLGLTVGCARCHDHRYDPISQADYYRFRAIFEPALDWRQWKSPGQRRVSLYTQADREARAAVDQKAKAAEQARTKRQQEHIDRTLYEELLVAPDEKRKALETAFRTPKDKRSAEQTALLEEHPNIGNISPGSLYLYAEQRGRRAGDIEKAAAKRRADYLKKVYEQLLQPLESDKSDRIRQALQIAEKDRNDSQKSLIAEITGGLTADALIQKHQPDGFAQLDRYRRAAKTCREQDAKTELANMQKDINAIRDTAPKENFLRALVEPNGHTPETHLFIRGDHNQPDKKLGPAELAILTSHSPAPLATNDPQLPTSGRRLAYARHLTNGKHPLTARVLANRIWLHHFGRGLVASAGDFGALGAVPTHPKLLDWLADELMRSGWQLKRLHRTILLSRVYQQSSARTDQLDRIDPGNQLYGRMSVRRLESESVRDAVLSVSNRLFDRMYGPPVPVREDAVGQIVLGKEDLDGERKPKKSAAEFPGTARRSVYVQVRRTRPLAVLETFDIAANTPNCAQRNFSNVATQALMMMNSPFVIDHADKMAADLIGTESNLSGQLATAWKRCYGRPIDSATLDDLTQFVHLQSETLQSANEKLARQDADRQALASVCQALISSNEFLYVD